MGKRLRDPHAGGGLMADKKGMAEHINALKKKGKLKTKARPSY